MKISKLEITNYRSIDSLVLIFPTYYSAICGKNNAGKTNIVRAIQSLMPEGGPFVYRSGDEISYKEDFPVWKKKEKSEEPINIALTLIVDKERDAGLRLFIEKFVKDLEDDSLEVRLSLKKDADSVESETTVQVNGTTVDDFSASEIIKKIRSSSAIFFYNSTELDNNPRFRYRRGFGGMVGEFSSADREKFDQMQQKVDNFIQSLAKKHQKEVTELLGKLEEKYSVGLTVPKVNLEYMPFEMSLGNKNFSVPLDDWGSGTRNRTQILLTILKAKKISESPNLSDKILPVLIIEEPESFLHPSAQAEFGRVIQDLSEELEVQVITTTHSPYMLSLDNPSSNVLLQRCSIKKNLHQTECIDTSGDDWMKPFGLALGIDNAEFEPWRDLLVSKGNKILLVEGDIDKEYFELLRDPVHGEQQLVFDGEVVAFGGKDTLKNTTLLKFVLNKYDRFFLTFDLDCENEVKRSLEILGLERNKHYIPIGLDAPGKRDIEGLLPEDIRKAVYGANVDLVQGAMSSNTAERNDSKRKLKKNLLEVFKSSSTPGPTHYGNFYKLVPILHKGLA